MWKPPEGMDKYLSPTKMCDCENPEILDKAREIIKDTKTPNEAALKIFYFMRDNIQYGVDMIYPVKASDTLKTGHGICLSKSHLQIALLRAVKIPARYHYADVEKECLKYIVSKDYYNAWPKIMEGHPWCECNLSGKWISCDTVLDKPLYDVLLKKGLRSKKQIPSVDWDGKTDLNMFSRWIVKDLGTTHDIDEVVRKLKEKNNERAISNLKKMGMKEIDLDKVLRSINRGSNRYTKKLRGK